MEHKLREDGLRCENCGISIRKLTVARRSGKPEPKCVKPKCHNCNQVIEPFDPNRIVYLHYQDPGPNSNLLLEEEEWLFCTDKCWVDWQAEEKSKTNFERAWENLIREVVKDVSHPTKFFYPTKDEVFQFYGQVERLRTHEQTPELFGTPVLLPVLQRLGYTPEEEAQFKKAAEEHMIGLRRYMVSMGMQVIPVCEHEDPDHTGQCIKCQTILDEPKPDVIR